MPMPIDGTDDPDFIVGSADDDFIQAFDGEDIVDGADGNDEILGGLGHDGLEGGAGDDILHGGEGNDTLTGGWFGDADYETLFGDAGDDLLFAPHISDSEMHGGDGADTAQLSWYQSALDWHVEVSLAGAASIYANLPSLNSSISFDSIERLVVLTGTGDDIVTGGALNDDINVMDGANTVNAGGGDDSVSVLAGGANVCDGGDGADVLRVNATPARLVFVSDPAGARDNFGSAYVGFERYVVSGYHGADRARLAAGDDVFLGQGGDDRSVGAGGNDRLAGGQSADWLNGGAGDDKLQGGNGDDTLMGGGGADLLSGGRGQDALYGGGGADRFLLAAIEAVADTIFDMQAGLDRLLIRVDALGGALAAGAVDDSRFALGAAAGAEAQFVRVDGAGETLLYWDADGDGAGAAALLCRFANGGDVTAANLLIIG